DRCRDRPLERRWAQLALGARSNRRGRSSGVVAERSAARLRGRPQPHLLPLGGRWEDLERGRMSATLIILLCAIACPVSMGLMMVFMRRGHGASHRRSDGREDADVDAE